MMTQLLRDAARDAETLERTRLANLTNGPALAAAVDAYRLQVSVWMARMESNMTNRAGELRAVFLSSVACRRLILCLLALFTVYRA